MHSVIKIKLWLILEIVLITLTLISGVPVDHTSVVERQEVNIQKQTPLFKEFTLDTEQSEVAQIIYDKSIDYGLDSDMTLQIAWCESQFRSEAKNPTSSATGVYQFLDGTWETYSRIYNKNYNILDRLNSEKNIDLALEIMSKKGISDWNASNSCHQYS